MEPNTPVVITDIDIPFGSMVAFMVKWTFATIPAAILIAAIVLVITVIVGLVAGSL